MRSGQIRESCGGCNNAGCRSFSFCGRPKAESALRHFGKKGNAPSVLRLVSLPAVAFSMQIASLSGKIRNARCAHSNSLRSLLSVFPCGSPMALREKRQRTFGASTRFTPCCRIFHADRFALRENPQRTFGAPTRFTPCCRIFHADRFALWENPQRSLRSLLWLRLQGREIRRNFLKIYSDMLRPVPILCSQQGSILCRSIRPEIFRISAAGWCLCHPDNGIEKLKFLYESLWDTISIQAFSI